MKDKRIGTRIKVSFLTIMLLFHLYGCSLAVENGDGAQSQDQLIGALVTKDYVEKTFADVNWRDNGIDSLSFEGIDGYYFLYTKIDGVDGEPVLNSRVSGIDCKFHIAVKNEQTTIELNANLLVIPDEDNTVYLNPIYQTADKQVYVAAGDSIGFGEGVSVENGTSIGKSISTEEKTGIKDNVNMESVKITADFELAYEPVKIRFSEKDENHNLIKTAEFIPGEIPNNYTTQEQTAYILVETETIGADGNIISTREICSWDGTQMMTDETGDQSLEKKCTGLQTPYTEGKGFVLEELTWVMWP